MLYRPSGLIAKRMVRRENKPEGSIDGIWNSIIPCETKTKDKARGKSIGCADAKQITGFASCATSVIMKQRSKAKEQSKGAKGTVRTC